MSNLMSDRRHAFGYLTTENADAVAKRLQAMLVGKRYTFVAVNEYLGYRPEVRTSQRLKPGNRAKDNGTGINVWSDDGRTGITVDDTYGVWGVSTSASTEKDFDKYTPFLDFTDHQVQIHHLAPAGHQLMWVIAVEDDNA